MNSTPTPLQENLLDVEFGLKIYNRDIFNLTIKFFKFPPQTGDKLQKLQVNPWSGLEIKKMLQLG